MRDETGGLASGAYSSNSIVSSKQEPSGLKTTNWNVRYKLCPKMNPTKDCEEMNHFSFC